MTYKKTHIQPIQDGKYFDHKLLTKDGLLLVKVRVFGKVSDTFHSEDGAYSTITLEDSTSNIRSKAFKGQVGLLNGLKAGQKIDLFGRVREFEGEKYLLPDIVKVIDDSGFGGLRDIELQESADEWRSILKQLEGLSEDEFRAKAKELGLESEEIGLLLDSPPEKEISIEDLKNRVKTSIIDLDTGEGVEYETIRSNLDIEENLLKQSLGELMNDGEVYEPKYGRYKRL